MDPVFGRYGSKDRELYLAMLQCKPTSLKPNAKVTAKVTATTGRCILPTMPMEIQLMIYRNIILDKHLTILVSRVYPYRCKKFLQYRALEGEPSYTALLHCGQNPCEFHTMTLLLINKQISAIVLELLYRDHTFVFANTLVFRQFQIECPTSFDHIKHIRLQLYQRNGMKQDIAALAYAKRLQQIDFVIVKPANVDGIVNGMLEAIKDFVNTETVPHRKQEQFDKIRFVDADGKVKMDVMEVLLNKMIECGTLPIAIAN